MSSTAFVVAIIGAFTIGFLFGFLIGVITCKDPPKE